MPCPRQREREDETSKGEEEGKRPICLGKKSPEKLTTSANTRKRGAIPGIGEYQGHSQGGKNRGLEGEVNGPLAVGPFVQKEACKGPVKSVRRVSDYITSTSRKSSF